MAEYNNSVGFEPTKKTRDLWCFIIKKESDYISFKLPPLFKAVSPFIRLFLLGFIFIFILEVYATFGVAYVEGVPILSITFLILLDILFAYLPHLWDGKICQKMNERFVANYSNEYTRLENLDESEYKKRNAADTGRLNKEIFNLKLIKNSLYLLVLISAIVKLYLFFQTYPFYNTYQAYIIIASYSLSAVLHIICTGNILMYFRFSISLKNDKNEFEKTAGKVNSYHRDINEKFINTSEQLSPKNAQKHNQKIVERENKFYIQYKGLLLDEELNDLINAQTHYKQKLSVAVEGKNLQLSMLKVDAINPE